MKQFFRIIVVFFVVIFLVQDVFSFDNSQPEFQQISYMQGLPGATVVKQIQDHYGIMWIAVEATGICRYDGHEFSEYRYDSKDENSISSNFVTDLIEDREGNIWVATLDGLNKYVRNENRFITYKHDVNNPKSIKNNVCNSLYFDGDNNLWIGTDNGLSKMDITNGIFEHFNIVTEKDLLNQHLSIFAIIEYPNGIFWLGTNQGLIKYETVTSYFKVWKNKGESTDEPIHNTIKCLISDGLGNLWLGTHRGLDRFDFNRQEFNHWNFLSEDAPFLKREGINNFFVDKEGILWAGTFTNGLLMIDPKTDQYQKISKETGGEFPLRSNHVKYILEDNMGSFWIGTKFEGIFKLNKSINIFDKWPKRLTLLEELKSKYIYSFFEDKNGICWFGSKLEGMFRVDIDNQKIDNYRYDPFDKNSIASNRIQSVIRDYDDELWVGTNLGLQLMNEKTGSFSTIENISVNVVYLDNKSTLWVGTIAGLYVVDKDKQSLTYFSTDKGLSNLFQNDLLNIVNIFQDSRGLLWISSRESGLFCYDYKTNKIKIYRSVEAKVGDLNSNMIRFCFEDSRGFIWIGTKAGGLNKFDPFSETFSNYLIDDGLPSNLILSMEEDAEGYLWIGTHNGISKFNVELETFENFNSDYGLASNVAEPGASWKFSAGELLFGGNDGFNVFYPDDIKKIESITPVLITSVKVLDKLVKQDIDSIAFLECKYDENYISFEFTLMDFNYPSRHEYEYFLEGFDDHWNKNGNRNYASYTSLPPGDYTFMVRAANELGNWSNSAPVCRIVIKPPFYNNIWFQIVVMILLFSTTFIIVRRKLNSINNTKIKLEGMISERTNKLEKAFDEINNQKKEIELHQTILEKRVQERTHDLELAKKKAEESDHLKSSFLANMSHEIRTPLNAICGFSSMMNDESTDSEMRDEYSEIINNNSNHLLNLIGDILDISKIEAGQLKINISVFNVNQLLSEIYTIFIEDLKKKGKQELTLICPVLSDNFLNVDLRSDQLRLKQVLVNLISNSIKFTAKGFIEFGYVLEEEHIKFYVKDSGIGISDENLNLIFNRFTKVENGNSIYAGTGIGLSISKSIVEMFGGKFYVDSELEKGTTFSFTVPYVDKNEN